MRRCNWTLGAVLLVAISGPTAAYACKSPKSAIGVARTVTLDTAGGKLYGGLQYKAGEDLLKEGEFILTYDDGPLRRHTRKVLEALKAHCTKATFFMVGRMAVADPKMVREVESQGHTIANHTWSHRDLRKRNARRAGGQIELGISAVRHATAKPIAPFFRFPYLSDPNSMIAYMKSRDFGVFSIDIDSYDYKSPKNPSRVYANIMRQVRARRKGIMLFHDIQPSTAGAMKRILDDMKREGFKIVHIVPKAPAKTLSNFDEQAAKLHEKRRTRATPQTIGGGDYEKVAGKRVKKKLRPTNVEAASARVASPRRGQSFAPPPTTSRPSPVSRPAPSKDWRTSVFGTN